MKAEHHLNAINWAKLSAQVIKLVSDYAHQHGQSPQRIELTACIELGSLPQPIEQELRRYLDNNGISYRIGLGRLPQHQLLIHWQKQP